MSHWLARRGVRLAAVAGLAVGLAALAGLTVGATTATRQATAQVRESNQLADAWSRVFVRVTTQDVALQKYLNTRTEPDRAALRATLGSAEPELTWITANGGSKEVFQVQLVRYDYVRYENTLRGIITAGGRGDRAQVDAYVEPAGLAFGTVRQQALANVVRVRDQLNDFLESVDARNRTLQGFAVGVFAVDLALFVVCTAMLIGYQRRVEQQAAASRHQALHDGMTGLANRILLWDRMEQALRVAARTGESVGLLVIDLDRFKEINDTLGHHHGDLLLQRVAARLRSVVRASDTVARLGGDEFAIILPNVQAALHAVEVAQRVLNEIRQPVELDGHVAAVDGSVGIAIHPLHSTCAEELFQHADQAMYAAKRRAGGVCVYPPADGEQDERTAAQQAAAGRRPETGYRVCSSQEA